MGEPNFRHELKYMINMADWMCLRARLKQLAQPDENAGQDGSYQVRSLYFDNYRDKAVVEKLMGANQREKFRLRYYGGDAGFIRLEKKSKRKRLTSKQGAAIGAGACEALLAGDGRVLAQANEPLLMELYAKLQTQQLRPKMIVDYRREAYVYPPGNVRITIDSNVRMTDQVQNFLQPGCVTIPSAGGIVLEVKYDAFLPGVMRDAVQLGSRCETEFSKYVVGRLAT